jgi:hypothetical protein
MPKVLADKEEVNFQEGIPAEPVRIYELLMGAFAEQRRSVVKFYVDGEDCMPTGEFPDTFELIEAESLSHDEITLRLSKEFFNLMSNLEEEILAYQANILISSWSDVFKQMDQFVSKIQPFADLIDHVLPFAQAYSPPWREKFEKVAREQGSVLEAVLKAFERNDPASLSNELFNQFIPLYQTVVELFTNEVIPNLENAVAQNASSTNS